MEYKDGKSNLVGALQETRIGFKKTRLSEVEDQAWYKEVFPNEIYQAIIEHGYLGQFAIPWVVEEFFFYSLDEIPAKQGGYRFDAIKKIPMTEWRVDLHVIGDWAGNPVSLSRDGVVYYARHGMGSWKYIRLAPNMGRFLDVLATWLRYFSVERERSILNADFEVDEVEKDQIRAKVLYNLSPEDSVSFLQFLLP